MTYKKLLLGAGLVLVYTLSILGAAPTVHHMALDAANCTEIEP